MGEASAWEKPHQCLESRKVSGAYQKRTCGGVNCSEADSPMRPLDYKFSNGQGFHVLTFKNSATENHVI